MVEAPCKRVIDRQGAAETHTAIHRKGRPTLKQQPDDFEVILVPSDRDPVFRNTAEAGHHVELAVPAPTRIRIDFEQLDLARGIGTKIENPNIDYAMMAKGMGIFAEGPITDPKDLGPALRRASDAVMRGEMALVDVVTQPR